MVLECMCNSNESVSRKVRKTSYNLVLKSLDDLRTMSKMTENGSSSPCVSSIFSFIYDRLTIDIELMITHGLDCKFRHLTVKAIQAISLLNKEMHECTRMTERVAACVFYQLRCRRSIMVKNLPPYNDVPWVLALSKSLPEESLSHWGEDASSTDYKRAVGKIARAPPSNPHFYYERNTLVRENGEKRLRLLKTKCEDLSWQAALEVVLANERLPELQSAPAVVHAFVSSQRARFQRDLARTTSRSRRCCINRYCKRVYPCYDSTTDRNDFYNQIFFHLFPKTERPFTQYWLSLLNTYSKMKMGAVSFCSNLCFEQSWVPRMKETLGSTHWILNTDDLVELEKHSSQRVHAVMKAIMDRNIAMQAELKELLERDKRSSTCLRERDVKAIVELMMHVINMDTTIAMFHSEMRSSGLVTKDPCPKFWRAHLSERMLEVLVKQSNIVLESRSLWMTNSKSSIICNTYDLSQVMKHCQTCMRVHEMLFMSCS
jgi:hypothetical protein